MTYDDDDDIDVVNESGKVECCYDNDANMQTSVKKKREKKRDDGWEYCKHGVVDDESEDVEKVCEIVWVYEEC